MFTTPLPFLSLNLYFILACSNFQFTDILDLFRGFCGLMADNDKIRAGHIKISMMLFMNSPISFFTTDNCAMEHVTKLKLMMDDLDPPPGLTMSCQEQPQCLINTLFHHHITMWIEKVFAI